MRPILLPVCLAGLVLGAACAVNPATGQKELVLVSESQEIQMGLDADPGIITSLGLDPDSGRQRYVRALGTRLASTSERPNLPWTFRVIDDPAVNAFAIPGGHVYVTRGILAHLNSEAELAGVMGHEIGHVTARHSVTQMSQQQVAQLGLVLGSVIAPKLQRYAGAASQGLGLLFLKFSRDDESQADYLGYRYMRRQHYDGRQMPQVFTLLDRVTQASGSRVPDWLATHPNPGNRLEAINRDIAATPKQSLGTLVNREVYLRAIDGIVYGDNPRDGYVRNGEFVHPDLRFRISFPAGWTVQNGRDAVQAISPQQDAVLQLSVPSQPTPEQAATAFFAQQGVSGTPARVNLHGLPATTGEFTATDDQGAVVAGRVSYIAYEGSVYQVLAMTSQAGWPGVRDVAWRSTTSFDRLTDPAVLAAQPWHVQVVTVPRTMTVEEFARTYPGPVPVATVALVNNVDPTYRFAAGSLAKRIVGDPLP